MLVKEAQEFLRGVSPVLFFDDPRLKCASNSGPSDFHPEGPLTHFQIVSAPERSPVIEADALNVFLRLQDKDYAKASETSPMNPKPVRRHIYRVHHGIRGRNEIKMPESLNKVQAKARVAAFAGAAINLEKKGD